MCMYMLLHTAKIRGFDTAPFIPGLVPFIASVCCQFMWSMHVVIALFSACGQYMLSVIVLSACGLCM